MSVWLKLSNCQGGTIRGHSGGEFDTSVELTNSRAIHFDDYSAEPKKFQGFGRKVQRNERCPCGSGIKYKKCHGVSKMSTGIKSDNSSFTAGKATIIADVGVDLANKSVAHIDEFVHIAPDTPKLAEILSNMKVAPPPELVKEAVASVKQAGSIEVLDKSRIKKWCAEQGVNTALWAQLVTTIGVAALGG